MARTDRGSFVLDTVIITALLASFYGLTYGSQFQPLRIPGYLLLVWFDTVGGTFGPQSLFPVVFGAYLVVLALIGAAAAHAVRRRIPAVHLAGWRFGVAGALGVAGTLTLSFAATALVGTAQTDVVSITSATGLILLGLAGWVAGLFTVDTGWDRTRAE